VGRSLTRGWVCRLNSSCSSPVQSFLGPHFDVSDSRLPKPGRPGPRIYIPQEEGGHTTRIYQVEAFELASTRSSLSLSRLLTKSKSKSHCDWRSINQ
jgi:hypothetical protein